MAAAARPSCRPRGMKPCSVLDELGRGRGYRLALFDPKTDRLRSFLVSDDKGCRTTRRTAEATVFRSMREVEEAINRCQAIPCPP